MKNSENIDRLFVAYKPPFISSNRFLSQLKKSYRVKKAGFSGTLDPFAKGVLVVAFGKYTKFFRFLNKSPKKYRATLWLGTKSESFDIENIKEITKTDKIDEKLIMKSLSSLKGRLTYSPPNFSAKKIDGKRAYKLARENVDFKLKEITTKVYSVKLINYSHPFLTFDIEVDEGGYIRSIAQILAKKLNQDGTLSSLERLQEGNFVYEDQKALNPLNYLKLEENFYLKNNLDIKLGKKLKISDFKIKKEGRYLIKFDTIISIVEIKDDKIHYLLNGVNIC